MDSISLQGRWAFYSFFVLPEGTDLQQPIPPMPTAQKWQSGELVLRNEGQTGLHGELTFETGKRLLVSGKILPSTGGTPPIIELVGRFSQPSAENLQYELMGWVLPPEKPEIKRATIRGSLLVAPGAPGGPGASTSQPSTRVANRAGAFVLTPLA